MILKNAILILDANTSEVILENGDIMVNCKSFSYHYRDSIDSAQTKHGIVNRLIHFLVFFLYHLADVIHGIESGYKMCCILAFIKKETIFIPNMGHALCYKCYKKLLKKEKKL